MLEYEPPKEEDLIVDKWYWLPEERPSYVFHGRLEIWGLLLSLARNRHLEVLAVSGGFGSGKSTLINILLETGNWEQIVPLKTRRRRTDDRNFKQADFRRWTKLSNVYEAVSIPLNAIDTPSEYLNWARRLEIKPPAPSTVLGKGLLREFISCYEVDDIIRTSKKALRDDKKLVIELTPQHEKDWRRIFPDMRVIRLYADPETIAERLDRRRLENPGFDPEGVLTATRIAESVSTPTHLEGDDESVIVAPSSNWVDLEQTLWLTEFSEAVKQGA